MIKREDIEKRLEALKSDLQVLDFRMAAVHGAIQDCEHWLRVLDEMEQKNGGDAADLASASLNLA